MTGGARRGGGGDAQGHGKGSHARCGDEARPHQVAATYYTGADFQIGDVDLFVDITDQAQNRVKAEILLTTQALTPDAARKRIDIGTGNAGWFARTGYAEGWMRSRPEVGRYLTITDHDLEAPEISREELFARLGARVT